MSHYLNYLNKETDLRINPQYMFVQLQAIIFKSQHHISYISNKSSIDNHRATSVDCPKLPRSTDVKADFPSLAATPVARLPVPYKLRLLRQSGCPDISLRPASCGRRHKSPPRSAPQEGNSPVQLLIPSSLKD